MNSYNDNLQSTIASSLSDQELELQTAKSKLDASLLTLYYSEGAQITAHEKFDTDTDTSSSKAKVMIEAVNVSNISANLLTSASDQKSQVAQAVSNTAVSAANIQIMANAVLRLTGDIGNIFSMVSAADNSTHLQTDTEPVHKRMSETAYLAEKVSQEAMNASKLMAGVASATVADQAKSANDAVSGLRKVAVTEFENSVSLVVTDSSALAAASVTEKSAERAVEDANVEYFAARHAYDLNIREMNLDLRTTPIAEMTSAGVTVSFAPFRSAFHTEKEEKGYPVTDYYIFLVRDSEKSVFSIANAESLLTGKDFVKVPPTPLTKNAKRLTTDLYVHQMKDTGGEPMELGRQYVVFVMAVLSDNYKKNLNVYEDFLSAPSETFSVKIQLLAATELTPPDNNNEFTFTVPRGNKNFTVEYRCMFLPDKQDLVTGLLTEQSLRRVEQEVEKLASIAEHFDPLIEKLQSEIGSLRAEQDALDYDIIVKTAEMLECEEKKALIKKEKPKDMKEQLDALRKQEDSLAAAISADVEKANANTNRIKEKTAKLNANTNEKNLRLRKMHAKRKTRPGFYFNAMIAEQVSSAAYYQVVPPQEYTTLTASIPIKDDTLDNFGNRLIDGNTYIPVVLTILRPQEMNQDQFTSALTDYQHTQHFKYTDPKKHNSK